MKVTDANIQHFLLSSNIFAKKIRKGMKIGEEINENKPLTTSDMTEH